MNVYAIWTKYEYPYTAFSLGEMGSLTEYERIFEVIVAETPGKAKSILVRREAYVEYTDPMTVKCIVKNVDAKPGISSIDEWPYCLDCKRRLVEYGAAGETACPVCDADHIAAAQDGGGDSDGGES